MSIFLCSRCDQYIDEDYEPCVEDPKLPGKFKLMCEEHEEEDKEDGTKPREFSKEQLAIIESIKRESDPNGD